MVYPLKTPILKFTESAGKSLFLPAGGYRWNDETSYVGEGYYWSSTQSPNYSHYAYYFCFYDNKIECDDNSRLAGYSVRPVSQ